MLSEIIQLISVYILFSVFMIIIGKNKNVAYGKIVFNIFLPALIYLLYWVIENSFLNILYHINIIFVFVFEAIKWIICSIACVVAAINIFKTVNNVEDKIIDVFKNYYKKWNLVIGIFIILGIILIITKGIDYSIHQKEYENIILNIFASGSFLDAIKGNGMPVNIIIFESIGKIIQILTLGSVLIPSLLKTKKKNI